MVRLKGDPRVNFWNEGDPVREERLGGTSGLGGSPDVFFWGNNEDVVDGESGELVCTPLLSF